MIARDLGDLRKPVGYFNFEPAPDAHLIAVFVDLHPQPPSYRYSSTVCPLCVLIISSKSAESSESIGGRRHRIVQMSDPAASAVGAVCQSDRGDFGEIRKKSAARRTVLRSLPEARAIASWIRPSCSPMRSSLCSKRNKIGRSCAEAISINSLSRLYFCSREPLPLASAIRAKLLATSLILGARQSRTEDQFYGISATYQETPAPMSSVRGSETGNGGPDKKSHSRTNLFRFEATKIIRRRVNLWTAGSASFIMRKSSEAKSEKFAELILTFQLN